MIKEALNKLMNKTGLTASEAESVMEEIMTGAATQAQIAGILVALRLKGETSDEITGFARVMRKHVTHVHTDQPVVLDTCGTGGDGASTFNISTLTALVAAGAGVTVAKHGNRSVSSQCGSADVLKELGVNIEVSPQVVEECLKKIGIGFLFAPLLHQAMKYAAPVRKELGIRTVFNILGPLTNPAFATNQLLGVYHEGLTLPICEVLCNLGSKHAMVVHGNDGLDEVTTTTSTTVTELKGGEIRTYKITPGQFGLKVSHIEDLKGGDARNNAKVILEILNEKHGLKREIVLLNAGCAIYAADKAKDIKAGIQLAAESIDSGKALAKLTALIEYTNSSTGIR
jgi:anthranilate phosphoribosyltransferase